MTLPLPPLLSRTCTGLAPGVKGAERAVALVKLSSSAALLRSAVEQRLHALHL